MAVDEKEWTGDTKALAACLEALLQLVRGQAGPAAPAANDQGSNADAASCNPPSRDIASGFQPE